MAPRCSRSTRSTCSPALVHPAAVIFPLIAVLAARRVARRAGCCSRAWRAAAGGHRRGALQHFVAAKSTSLQPDAGRQDRQRIGLDRCCPRCSRCAQAAPTRRSNRLHLPYEFWSLGFYVTIRGLWRRWRCVPAAPERRAASGRRQHPLRLHALDGPCALAGIGRQRRQRAAPRAACRPHEKHRCSHL